MRERERRARERKERETDGGVKLLHVVGWIASH